MIGIVLGDRYEILEKIGTGGMGDVYKAHDRKLDRIVAIKVLKREYNDDNNFIRKFKRESYAAASMTHPNIVGIFDVGSENIDNDNVYYIVMEYIDGKTLKDLIGEEGRLNEKRALNYCVQIAEALKTAHSKNIVHRDIKSQNIMVDQDDRVKVTDFGIARIADNSTVTATNAIMGSVHYFSPEQARGSKVDNRSDIYSLGVVLYEMLTGKLPFDAENPVSVALMQVQSNMPRPSDTVKNISKATDNLVLKMTMKDPNERYKDASALIRDIKNVQLGRNSRIHDDIYETRTTVMDERLIDERLKNGHVHNDSPLNNRNKKIVRRPVDNNYSSYDRNEVDDMKPKKKKKKKKSATPVILGIITALLIFGMIIFIVPKVLFHGGEDPNIQATTIAVPQLVGVSEDEAATILKAKKLVMNVSEVKEDGDFSNNEIISQSPEANERVEEGTEVSVVVNKLPDSIKVPDLKELTLKEAQDQLEALGLRITDIENEYSDDVEEGKIISQEPVADSEVLKDKDLKIVISKGKDTKEIVISNTTGMSEKAAKEMLQDTGFKVSIVREADNTVAPGEVFKYDPRGTAVKGTIITLYVRDDSMSIVEEDEDKDKDNEKDTSKDNDKDSSKDKDTSRDNEKDTSKDNDKDSSKDKDTSNEAVDSSLSVRVADDGERHRIIVKRFMPNGKNYVLYDYHKTAADGTVEIPIQGKQGDRFELYVDDSLEQSKSL